MGFKHTLKFNIFTVIFFIVFRVLNQLFYMDVDFHRMNINKGL